MADFEVRGADALKRHMVDPRLAEVPVTTMLRTAAKEGEAYAEGRVKSLQSVVRTIQSEAHGMQARVYSTHPAAKHIEVGRKPGTFPPERALAAWAARHGIIVAPFVLARAISRRGIRGRYFMRGARARMKTRWRQYMKVAAKDIERRWRS